MLKWRHMRILFFNYEYPPLGGGAGNASKYILQQYAKMPDVEVDFVTSSIDQKYHLENIGENIRIHRLPIGKNSMGLHYQTKGDLIRYTRMAWKFSLKLTKENNYDLSHSFFSVPCGALSLGLKLRRKLPYIVSLRGADVPGYSERFKSLYGILTPIIKMIWKNAAFVISNSKGLRQLALLSDPNRDIGIIPNGVDTEMFHPSEETETKEYFEILCVSRITPRKGIRFLIKALEKFIVENPYVHLTIIGDGNEKESLENLVRGLGLAHNVTFKGLIPHDHLPEEYRRADVFVLPSLNEGMSNTMLEAVASGLPIVATQTGGSDELVCDGANGLIVRMQDSDDLAEKLSTLIKQEQMRSEMGKKSRELALTLSWESVAKQYVGLYREIANNKN